MGAQLSIVGTEPEAKLDFETFWLVWAGKQMKRKLCLLQWGYMPSDQQAAAIEGAIAWRGHWLRKDWEYRPEPLKWMQGEQWDDVPPKLNGVQQAFTAEPKRGELSQFARDAIAKIAAAQKSKA